MGCLPDMEFEIEEEMAKFFDISTYAFKPEAPWLNRVNGSI